MSAASPQSIAVVGGGAMGCGIAHAFLIAGHAVVLVEPDEPAARRAAERVGRLLDQSVARGQLAGASEALGRLEVRGELGELGGVVLAVEAVPEDPALKVEVLAQIEGAIGDRALLTTNTSSISIGELASALERPARFLGLHFFNPVPASSLVEIVVGPSTAADAVARAQGYVHELSKQAITVRDSPGFASSRLGVAVALEAIRMLEEGVASAEDIDRAMTLGYRHPMGPLHLTDLVGLDVRLAIAEYLHASLGPRFEPPALLRELVAEGRLGRKAGRGFFGYAEASRA